jgi:hypothetical protein
MARMNRPAWVGVLILLGLLFAGSAAQARQIDFAPPGPPRDRLPPPRVGTATLTGRVVDGITGVPLPRTRVRINGGGPRPSVTTDASGNFVFSRLPAGPYTVIVEKSGYQSGAYPERGRGMRPTTKPLVIQEGQALDPISISLYRGGVIAGRVLDGNGEPVESAQVRAFNVPRAAAGSRPQPGNGTTTNDLGEFRLARLETGSYFLMAVPQRMAVPDEPGPDGKPQPQPQPAPAYYPNVVAIDQAQSIPVQRGQTVSGIDITMGEVFMGVVAGTVIDPSGQPVTRNTQIAITTIENSGFGGSGTTTSLRPDGTFRARVAPGDYVIEARFTPTTDTPGGEHDMVGRESVTITSGGSETLLITLGAGATASGRVVFDGSSPPPQNLGQVRVPLQATNGRGCTARPAQIAPDWSFSVEGLIGTCRSQPFGLGRWMLKAVLHQGEDLLDRSVTFKPGQQYRDVQVVFTDRRSEIVFRVSAEGGQTTREYVAVVFPADPARWAANPGSSAARAFVPPQIDTPIMDTPAPAGVPTARAPAMPPPRREAMSGIRPGEYFAIAVDNMEYEDMRDPAVLKKLAEVASPFTLGDGVTIEVPLRRVNFADVMR